MGKAVSFRTSNSLKHSFINLHETFLIAFPRFSFKLRENKPRSYNRHHLAYDSVTIFS